MTKHTVERDERTVAVENASYRLGYRFVTFALLLSIAYRAFALKQTSWDLFTIVILGGVVTALYQRNHRTLTMRWVRLTVFAAALAIVVAALLRFTAR